MHEQVFYHLKHFLYHTDKQQKKKKNPKGDNGVLFV